MADGRCEATMDEIKPDFGRFIELVRKYNLEDLHAKATAHTSAAAVRIDELIQAAAHGQEQERLVEK